MNQKVEVEVSKEAYELGQGLAKFHKAVKVALADGFQVGQDLPPIIQSAIADLVPAVQGAELLGEESKADMKAFANALYLGSSEIVFEYVK